MRILFLSRWYPYPPNNGSKLRIAGVLRQLAREHEVDLLAFRQETDVVRRSAAGTPCAHINTVPYRAFRPRGSRSMIGLLARRPRFLVDTYSPAFARTVQEQCRLRAYDLVIASQLDMVPYVEHAGGMPTLLEELEVTTYLDATRQGSRLHRARSILTWLKLSSYLRRVLPRFFACTVVSEQERANLLLAAPGYQPVHVIPNGVDLASCTHVANPPTPGQLVFAGALNYEPNLAGLQFFLRDVMPKIRRQHPAVRLQVTGSLFGVDTSNLPQSPDVTYTGYLDDVRPAIATSWASIVPLLSGGGTRLKILESMALGTPVVATRKGAEGLDVVPGIHFLLADEAETFAERVVDVLSDTGTRERLATAGRRLIEERYDWAVIGPRLLRIVDQALNTPVLSASSATRFARSARTVEPVA